MFWMMILCFVFLVVLAVVIYLLPSDPSTNKPKRKEKERKEPLMPDPAVAAKQKDWEQIAHRWEKQNNALLGEVEKLKQEQKKLQLDIDQQKNQQKDLVEKLTLEKSWREKEQATLDKFKGHEKDLKDQIVRTEGDLEKEHSLRLRLERDLQEIKIKYDQINDEKRELSVQARALETTLNQANKDLSFLKRENQELSKRREDIQWVAKSEHDELKKKFNDLTKQLEQVKNPNA